MMKKTNFYFFILLFFQQLVPTVLIQGNGNAPLTFSRAVNTKVFDRATGTFYVGLLQGAGDYSLAKANRSANKFTFIGQSVSGTTIEFLTLITSIGNTNPSLAIVQQNVRPFQQQKVFAAFNDGTGLQQSNNLLDASGGLNQDGLPTSGIIKIAASQFFIFAAVRPSGGAEGALNFGANCFSGIASVGVNQNSLALTQMPAVAGDSGIKAKRLDGTTPEILINNSPIIDPFTANFIELYWDEPLQRLYIGLPVTSVGTASIGPTCATAATCPTGFIFDPVSQTCITMPTGPTGLTCPTGFNFDPTTNTCVTSPTAPIICPTGFLFDQINNTCVTAPTGAAPTGIISCASGYFFDISTQTCIASIVSGITGDLCPSGMIIDPITGQGCVPGPFLPPTVLPTLNRVYNFGGPFGIFEEDRACHCLLESQEYRAPLPSGAKSIIVASVDSNGVITFNNIAPNTAFALGQLHNMVGVFDVNAQSLTVNKLRIMHTSTGPSYLILNGGNGTPSTISNQIVALPLVDDPTNPSASGTLAKKDAPLVNFKFVVPAATNADLPLDSEPAVMVGCSLLPLPPSGQISDMSVIGDAVYVSMNIGQSTLSDTGIFYSQAQFDETGKIIRWTPWTKKIFPPNGFTGNPVPNSIQFFEVDAVTGKTWAIDALTKQLVVRTSWDKPMNNGSLPGQINANIPNAATAVLDLDQSTPGFTGILSTMNRYALFAGNEQVIFARISQALLNPPSVPLINSPQTIFTNFNDPANFLVTELPRSGCQINILEYSRQVNTIFNPNNMSNFFFAGTQSGLFAFADPNGDGFNVGSFAALNQPPFSTGSWQQVPGISGSVIDIKTTGNALYVLTSNAITLQSSLYKVPFASNLTIMFSGAEIIAQSGIAPFDKVIVFNGIQIISTMPDGSTEQLVLATNNGLFQSMKLGGVQNAINQADADWQLISDNAFYTGIGYIDNASITSCPPATVWPFSIRDESGLKTFNRSLLQQLNGSSDTAPFAFVPPAPFFFNSNDITNNNFRTIPLITYFWSDGGRRFMITPNVASFCTPFDIVSFPFNTLEWNVNNPNNALLDETALNNAATFYWTRQIGVSGILLVGTEKGVVALE